VQGQALLSAPITQTRNTKLRVKVTLDTAGIAGMQCMVRGTSATAEMNFTSAPVVAGNVMVVEIEAAVGLGPDIRSLAGGIRWEVVVSPGAQQATLDAGLSGEHTVFTTFGVPKNPGNQGHL
jgi:hypothetical protein